MHLISSEKQQISINGETFEFAVGDRIHTENSYKYSIEEFSVLAEQAGFSPVEVWTDNNKLFSVHYYQIEPV